MLPPNYHPVGITPAFYPVTVFQAEDSRNEASRFHTY
jgi:hypothetical protein